MSPAAVLLVVPTRSFYWLSVRRVEGRYRPDNSQTQISLAISRISWSAVEHTTADPRILGSVGTWGLMFKRNIQVISSILPLLGINWSVSLRALLDPSVYLVHGNNIGTSVRSVDEWVRTSHVKYPRNRGAVDTRGWSCTTGRERQRIYIRTTVSQLVS